MASVELYRYVRRYTIPFIGNDIGDPVAYRVDLLQRRIVSATPPEVVELDGAPSPFEFSLANDDDPLLPIRTSTAKISFIDDIDVTSLLPANGFEWGVQLVRVEDEAVVFAGYLTGEVFTQPYIEGPNIVTVNAVSVMVPALASAMDIVGRGSLTIGKVIAQAARLSKSVTKVFIPAMYEVDYYDNPAHFTDLLRLRFSAWRYMRFADNAQITGEQFECDTYSKAIRDICTLFGWSMYDVGDGSLYFVAPGYTGAYMQLAIEELEFDTIFTPHLVQPTTFSVEDIEAVDAGDTMEVRQGYRSVMLTAEAVEAQVQMADVKDQVKGWSYQRESVSVDVQQFTDPYELVSKNAEIGKKIATFSGKNISIPRYRCTGIYDENDLLTDVEWSEVTDGSEDANADVFTNYIESDSCAPAELSTEDGEAAKREWSFSPMFRIREQAVTYAGDGLYRFSRLPDEYYIMRMIGSAGLLSGGAIVIDFDMRATTRDGFHIPADYYVAGGDIEGSMLGVVATYNTDFWGKSKRVVAALKVGDLWWNGQSWVEEECRFDIPISTTAGEWHSVLSNKTVDMPYAGGRGLFIPLAQEVEGQVEFYLYPRLAEATELADRPEGDFVLKYDGAVSALIDIKGLTISFAPRLDYVDVSDTSSTYYRDFGRSFPNQLDISLALHSRVNNATQLSLLYKESGQPLDTLFRGALEAKPEQFLLDSVQRIYANVVRRWRRGMALQTLVPIVMWENENGAVLMPTGATINYAEGVGEVYLTELQKM